MKAAEKMNLSIRKNDVVQVIAGKDKGKQGKVLRIDRVKGRIFVEKINLAKRHMRPSQQNPSGGILEKELPLDYSNVLLMCAKCNKGVRHGVQIKESAKGVTTKTRVCKKCGESLEYA